MDKETRGSNGRQSKGAIEKTGARYQHVFFPQAPRSIKGGAGGEPLEKTQIVLRGGTHPFPGYAYFPSNYQK